MPSRAAAGPGSTLSSRVMTSSMAGVNGGFPESFDASQAAVFQEHMRECPPCEVYLDTYQETIRLGKCICEPDGSMPADVPEELVQAILAARKAG